MVDLERKLKEALEELNFCQIELAKPNTSVMNLQFELEAERLRVEKLEAARDETEAQHRQE